LKKYSEYISSTGILEAYRGLVNQYYRILLSLALLEKLLENGPPTNISVYEYAATEIKKFGLTWKQKHGSETNQKPTIEEYNGSRKKAWEPEIPHLPPKPQLSSEAQPNSISNKQINDIPPNILPIATEEEIGASTEGEEEIVYVDEEGNPLTDQDTPADSVIYVDEEGNEVDVQEEEIVQYVDEEGNPIEPDDGDTVYVDEEGNEIQQEEEVIYVDEEGNPVSP
jgi:hypothetical protein